MANFRLSMEVGTDTMPNEFFDYIQIIFLGMFFDNFSDFTIWNIGPTNFDCFIQTFFSNTDQMSAKLIDIAN